MKKTAVSVLIALAVLILGGAYWQHCRLEEAGIQLQIARNRTTADAKTAPLPEPKKEVANPQPTALDVKAGFKEFHLGVNRNDFPDSIFCYADPAREDTDLCTLHRRNPQTGRYEPEKVPVGRFQVSEVMLQVDKNLGILKEITVQIEGAVNEAGMLEVFREAYGEPEPIAEPLKGYEWKGVDVNLKYYYNRWEANMGLSALATWRSQKVDEAVQQDHLRRARHGASDAAKNL